MLELRALLSKFNQVLAFHLLIESRNALDVRDICLGFFAHVRGVKGGRQGELSPDQNEEQASDRVFLKIPDGAVV